MGNHPFNVIVILFWLATMSWLVVAKIVPPLRVGEPPNYASIVDDAADDAPACWTIRMNGRTIGWAANRIVRTELVSELHNRVFLEGLPIDELAPGWLTPVLKPVVSDLQLLDIDKRSRLVIDPLGRLAEFESLVRLANLPDAIRVHGSVDGSTLKLTVESGGINATIDRTLAPGALVSDELSPQTRMPGLRVGQTWTVPLYSPFRAPNSPLDILQAVVEREDPCRWDGHTVNTRVVVYRGDSGSGLASGETRGRMWVRDDGVVLRQAVQIFRSEVQFERLPERQAAALRQALPDSWTRPMPQTLARQVLERLRAAVLLEPEEEDAPTADVL